MRKDYYVLLRWYEASAGQPSGENGRAYQRQQHTDWGY